MGSHTCPRTSSVVTPTSDALAFTDDFEPTVSILRRGRRGDVGRQTKTWSLHRFASKGVASELVHLVWKCLSKTPPHPSRDGQLTRFPTPATSWTPWAREHSHESVAQGARRRDSDQHKDGNGSSRRIDATGRGTGHYPKGLHETPEDVQAGDARQGPLQE